MAVVEVEDLAKSYGEIVAVDGISFAVEEGEIFGMVGPNGAGKTTTVEIIEGLREPDRGRARILGLEVRQRGSHIKDRIGVQLQTVALYPNLNVVEVMALFASFFSRSLPIGPIIERLGLDGVKHTLSRNLSGGQRQRLSLALALVNDPDILFLDEPTTGLDPQARRSVWELIRELKSRGKTIFLTTHYMEEAEELCDRVAIIDYGKILVLDKPDRLISRYFQERAIQFESEVPLPQEELQGLPAVSRTFVEDTEGTIYSSAIQETLAGVTELAERHGASLSDVYIRRASLEDVFLHLTGRRVRE